MGEAFTPQILAGYYTPTDSPTEVVWWGDKNVRSGWMMDLGASNIGGEQNPAEVLGIH